MPGFDPYAGEMPFFPPSQPYPQPRRQASPPPPRQVAAPAPRPVFRAKAAEEIAPRRPATVNIPSPEDLGLNAMARTATLPAVAADWVSVRVRLQALGADCFQLQKLSDGRFYFLVFLPTGSASQSHRVEARADTEAEAVRLVLDRADQIHGQAVAAR